jgi:ABC-type Fe3+/spermidine/putrescine transport system ATPase subunit
MAKTASETDVVLDRVTKRFESVLAVDAMELKVDRGEFVSLLGPSGCGKTTTLRLIAGFEQPDSGQIRIGNEDVAGLPPYRRDVNTVFQSYALFPHLKVLDNVAYGLRHRGAAKEEREQQARAMLELVRLEGVEERRPSQLSGGQQQRVALARSLVMKPKVLLLDEPLGALDLAVRKQLQIELKRIQSEVGVTFIYVTHDQEEALAMSDRVVVMDQGRIEQTGTPREIYDSPASKFVADFIGDTNFVERNGATVAVRAERMRVQRGQPSSGAWLAGEVVATMVIGSAVQCVVRADDGQELLVREQRADANGEAESLSEGERVMVGWPDDAALVLEGSGKRQGEVTREE